LVEIKKGKEEDVIHKNEIKLKIYLKRRE